MDSQTPQEMIQDLRAAGLRQQQIASLAGLSQSYVCDLEKGRYGKRIGYDAYKKINDLHLRYFTLVGDSKNSDTDMPVFAVPQVVAGNTATRKKKPALLT